MIYLHELLGEEIVSCDGLPYGVLPCRILKMETYCTGLPDRCPFVFFDFVKDIEHILNLVSVAWKEELFTYKENLNVY